MPLRFLLGQGLSFLISGPSLSGPAQPAVHIRGPRAPVERNNLPPGAEAAARKSAVTRLSEEPRQPSWTPARSKLSG
jgi:hypothetical protein